MAFEGLSDKLNRVFKKLKQGPLKIRSVFPKMYL